MSASSDPDGDLDGLLPGAPVQGGVRVPGSKSHAQRLLLCASLASGSTRLVGLSWSADVRALRGALDRLGVDLVDRAPRAVTVRGRPPGPGQGLGPGGDPDDISLGESGTAARLLTAACALCGRAGVEIGLRAEGSLARRSSAPLLECLRRAGVVLVERGTPGGWPLSIDPIGPPSALALRDPVSSQEVSALFVALGAWPGEFHLRVEGELPSAPYVELTRRVLADFGASCTPLGPEAWRVSGPLRAPADPLAVEPDASAAAVALAAGCLSGGEASVAGLGEDSIQGDVRIVEHLRAFGCEAGADPERGLFARGAPCRGANVDLAGEPDLAPVLAAVAAGAARVGEASELTGLETLPRKESSRIEVLAEGLRAVGLEARATSHSLAIGPRTRGPDRKVAVVLDPHGDHRMAFAFALLGLQFEGVAVASPECVSKSWPSFWDDLARSGARRRGR